jgi:uncharacterized protein YdeI (YjbR/CyaY-like superfamily)
MAASRPPSIEARNAAAWRAWLARNAETSAGVWLIYYKKGSGTASIHFDAALDEALCFGWVDSKVKSLDAARYMMRFAPRKLSSSWSPSNIARVKRLIAQGKMTATGLTAFAGHRRRRTPQLPTRLPRGLERAFRADARAWRAFSAFPPGYRRYAIGWVASAKLEPTRERRLARLIEASRHAQRLPFI